jgi:hypothetical protein
MWEYSLSLKLFKQKIFFCTLFSSLHLKTLRQGIQIVKVKKYKTDDGSGLYVTNNINVNVEVTVVPYLVSCSLGGGIVGDDNSCIHVTMDMSHQNTIGIVF